MDKPLTKAQAIKWFKTEVARTFAEEFARLAKSGAVDPAEIDYGFAKNVLQLAAEKYWPLAGPYADQLKNLRHF